MEAMPLSQSCSENYSKMDDGIGSAARAVRSAVVGSRMAVGMPTVCRCSTGGAH